MINQDFFDEYSFEEFGKLFDDFHSEAFRIEFLNQYLVDGEKDLFEKSKKNELTDTEFLKFHSEWLNFIKKAKEQNKKIIRVHAVEKPYGKYLDFEINFSYRYNIQFGEEIRLLTKDKLFIEQLCKYPYMSDFWLFDNTHCIFLDYDNDGNFLGIKKLKQDYLENILLFKSYLLEASNSLKL